MVDAQKNLWRVPGEEETNARAYDEKRGEEICRTGLCVEQPLAMKLGPIKGKSFLPGTLRVEWLFARGHGVPAQRAR